MEDDDQQQKAMYLDQQDFLAEFLLSPDIKDEADYSHIDKNLSVTRLASRFKEPEQARHILKALHVLNNNKYFRDIVVQEKTGETEERDFFFFKCPVCGLEGYDEQGGSRTCKCGSEMSVEKFTDTVPIYKKVIRRKSLFPRAFHNIKARFYALTTTSMARDGHLLRGATTTHFSKSESVEDRTKAKSNPFGLVRGGGKE